jgi:hypothetical protein
MKFNFDKYVEDLERRKAKNKNEVLPYIIEEDRLRRLRAERYHERWQNRIKWERK